MAKYYLPIWIHPSRDKDVADYPEEKFSRYGLFMAFGWPYETTIVISRLVFIGIMEMYPNLKIIVHHCGEVVPFFSNLILLLSNIPKEEGYVNLTRPPM